MGSLGWDQYSTPRQTTPSDSVVPQATSPLPRLHVRRRPEPPRTAGRRGSVNAARLRRHPVGGHRVLGRFVCAYAAIRIPRTRAQGPGGAPDRGGSGVVRRAHPPARRTHHQETRRYTCAPTITSRRAFDPSIVARTGIGTRPGWKECDPVTRFTVTDHPESADKSAAFDIWRITPVGDIPPMYDRSAHASPAYRRKHRT